MSRFAALAWRSYVAAMVALLLALLVASLSGCASCSRAAKDWDSNMSGGLDRTVRVYDFEGDEVAEWSGKIDLERESDGTWKFDIVQDDGSTKRVIVRDPSGIVVSEED